MVAAWAGSRCGRPACSPGLWPACSSPRCWCSAGLPPSLLSASICSCLRPAHRPLSPDTGALLSQQLVTCGDIPPGRHERACIPRSCRWSIAPARNPLTVGVWHAAGPLKPCKHHTRPHGHSTQHVAGCHSPVLSARLAAVSMLPLSLLAPAARSTRSRAEGLQSMWAQLVGSL